MLPPCDWDGESHCVIDGCEAPATHRSWVDMVNGHDIYDMVCCEHATPRP